MRKFFGTDGIRGVANAEPMNSDMMMKVGRSAANYFKKTRPGRHRVVLGKDTRISGYMLENALASGICSMGVDIMLVGPLPTPGIAFITTNMRADAGFVISASHNPYQDNGLKIFDAQGFKLPDDVEIGIERGIFDPSTLGPMPTGADIGKARRIDDAMGRYVVHLKSKFPQGRTLEGMKVALDCANGAAYRSAPAVFEELGAKVIAIGVNPDGVNINENCGSLHPERVAELVRTHGADIGIALDGDADRVIVVDEKGVEVDGDKIMAISALAMHKKGELRGNAVVSTVMSNIGLDRCLTSHGLKLIRTQVGDRYVVERLREDNLNFGGEQSGHLVFLDHSTTGDGTLGALMLLGVMTETGKPMSELAKIMTSYPQVLKNIKVREKVPVDKLAKASAAIRKAEAELGDGGRVLVRYSGTEPKLRVMVEGECEDKITAMVDDIIEAIRIEIG